MPNLISVQVDGLLGDFDHHIEFPIEWEFVIIYGPNGVGKTKLLELINAVLELEPKRIASIPFDRATLRFTDGWILQVDQGDGSDEEAETRVSLTSDNDASLREEWVFTSGAVFSRPHLVEFLASTTWRQTGLNVWEDQTDGEMLDIEELERRYGPALEGRVGQPVAEPSPALQAFAEEYQTHLIETQRLLYTPDVRLPTMPRRNRNRSRATVAAYAEDLKRRLGRALAANSRTTQQLDRTFPRRILSKAPDLEVSDDLIRQKYEEQNALRARLARISVIGGEPDLPLPQRTLADWERNVLWTYLSDTDDKLRTFDELLSKVTLFQDIVNQRFLRKELTINTEDGLGIVTKPGGRKLAPESLSSGEQHELILIYDLLFNVLPGSLVLIDEPEISLHVAWQKNFLDDINRIASLASLRFIIATHSPQIINKWWERTQQLGPESELS